MTQEEKALRFQALHRRPGTFVMPNPWDVGSARLLAGLGFEALATTSAGHAFSLGRADGGHVTRAEVLEHIRDLAQATDLPLSADLERGFADRPEGVAETIRRAADAGAVGGSIEDASGDAAAPIYDPGLAAERIHAAAEAARDLRYPFVLTARAENFLHGRKDLDDTIRRLVRFQDAGAHVLYAPGLATREQVAAVVGAVERPVNVVMGLARSTLTLAELETIGVKRVSIGGAFARTALAAFLRAAREVRDHGTFGFADEAGSFGDLEPTFEALLQKGAPNGA